MKDGANIARRPCMDWSERRRHLASVSRRGQQCFLDLAASAPGPMPPKAVAILSLAFAASPPALALFRFLIGLNAAGLAIIVESWLNALVPRGHGADRPRMPSSATSSRSRSPSRCSRYGGCGGANSTVSSSSAKNSSLPADSPEIYACFTQRRTPRQHASAGRRVGPAQGRACRVGCARDSAARRIRSARYLHRRPGA